MTKTFLPTPPIKAEKAPKGRKSKSWRTDAEIQTRLSVVAELMIRRANMEQIAKATGSSLATAKRDVARVRTLWREAALENIEDRRQEAISQYKAIQLRAWDEYTRKKENENKNPRFLQIVMDAQAHIDDIEGTKKIPPQLLLNLPVDQSADDLTDDELAAIILAKHKPGTSGASSSKKA